MNTRRHLLREKRADPSDRRSIVIDSPSDQYGIAAQLRRAFRAAPDPVARGHCEFDEILSRLN